MNTSKMVFFIALIGALGASGAVFYEENFEPLPGTATHKASDGKIRFGGNATGQPAINVGEYAVGVIGDNTGIKVEDDGSGTNNVLFIDGRFDKTYGGAVVVDPSNFGGTASVARLSFDVTDYDRKGDGTESYVYVYAASGYDLSGTTDVKIVMDLKNAANTPTTVLGVNGGASTTLLASRTFDHTTTPGNLDVSFNYDGSSAVVVVWESRFKSTFKIDNIQITDDGVIKQDGDDTVVFFGGDAGIFNGDGAVNNLFVDQTAAGHIVQWNGVDSDGGSFGASGSLDGEGIGASLTNAANGLVLTTVDITPIGSNTFSSGSPNVLGVTGGDDGKFNTGLGESWTFEFNKDVYLNQLVLTALDGDAETVRITVDGMDTNTFTRLDASMTNLSWEASANKFVYTYAEPVLVTAGTDITIDGTSGLWGLQGVVVDVLSLIETLPLINFGGNPDLYTNETYQAELGGDAIVAWWGGDDDGRFLGDVGTLKDQGVGATLTSVKYGVTIETLAIDSTLPEGTNTFVSGGSLGILGGDNAKLDSANDEAWTLDFDEDVYLYKVGLKGFTGGLEVADVIIGGVTNTIVPGDCVAATSETGLNIYTFVDPILIPAGTDVKIDAPGGQWGIGNLIVGVMQGPATPASLYTDWLEKYPGLGASTNLTDNPDLDTVDNLAEYALGGDPTDGNDRGKTPVSLPSEAGGTNYFDYVYFEREDADIRGLTYEVVVRDDLVLGSDWTNIGQQVFIGPVTDGYRAVTNRFPMTGETKQFFKLNVELDL